ncbi:MAG: radical SAM protein [Candidatus Bathyarchaeia archaeon]|nr:radical SAM protein [Candidatus Bathyarchaeota archaeon]
MKDLAETRSLCPNCLRVVPAKITTDGVRVYMEKFCGEHGETRALLWSALKLYTRALRFSRPGKPAKPHVENIVRGCPFDCGLCPSHKQHTCLAILEITDACNLLCPICLADSKSPPRWSPTIEDIEIMLKELLRCEGKPTAIQLSGGEPTVRKDLLEIVMLCRDLGFKFIEIDTNGIELAKNPILAKDLADAEVSGVYLQFDGLSPEIHQTLRGCDLSKIKEKAIENCTRAGLGITLAATILKGVNEHQLWDIVRYAISRRAIGINFQPFAALGRYPQNLFNPLDRVTISDVQIGIEQQSGGKLKAVDFLPVPCPDPRCSSLLYAYYRQDGELHVITRLADMEQLIDKYSLKNEFIEFDNLLKAIADELSISGSFMRNLKPQAVGSSLRLLLEYLRPEGFFSIGCHFAQDAWTVDLERLSKCCVHELREYGRLIPFCLYNITSISGGKIYRGDLPPKSSGAQRG